MLSATLSVKSENIKDFDKNRKIKFIQRHKYGYFPKRPSHLAVKTEQEDRGFASGCAIYKKLIFTLYFEEGEFSFPVRAVIPKKSESLPAIVNISKDRDIPNRFLPIDEIVEEGFAVFSFCYEDILDCKKPNKSLSSVILKRQTLTTPSPLMLWAYGALVVKDYVKTLSSIRCDAISVVGHGFLATASLLAGIFDEGFAYVISNQRSEVDMDTGSVLPFLYSEGYRRHVSKTGILTDDRELLYSLIAPRRILIGQALDGVVKFLPDTPDCLLKANGLSICELKDFDHVAYAEKREMSFKIDTLFYFQRVGGSYFSRRDWNTYISYIKSSLSKAESEFDTVVKG